MSNDSTNFDLEDSLRRLSEGKETGLVSEETSLSVISFENTGLVSYARYFGNGRADAPIPGIRARLEAFSDDKAGKSIVIVDFQSNTITGLFRRIVNECNYTLYGFFLVRLMFPDEYICVRTNVGIPAGEYKDNLEVTPKSFNRRTQFGAGMEWGVTNLNNTAPPMPPWNRCVR